MYAIRPRFVFAGLFVGALLFSFGLARSAIRTASTPDQDAVVRCEIRMQKEFGNDAKMNDVTVTRQKRREYLVEGPATIDGRPRTIKCIYKGSERRVRFFALTDGDAQKTDGPGATDR